MEYGDQHAAAAAAAPVISPPGLDEPASSHERGGQAGQQHSKQTKEEEWVLFRAILLVLSADNCACVVLLNFSDSCCYCLFRLFASGGRGGAPSNPDDWVCDGCSNRNYARRSKCNRCQLPRPGFTPPVRKFPAGVLSKEAIEKSAGQYHVGDWACAKCGFV